MRSDLALRRVLLVEDNESDAKLVQIFCPHFVSAGLEHAKDSDEAFDKLGQAVHTRSLPSLILLDLNIPGVGGLEILKYVKSEEGLRQIPIVVISSSQNPKEIFEVYAAGASAFVPKRMTLIETESMLRALDSVWSMHIAYAPATEYRSEFELERWQRNQSYDDRRR
ncbi:MAG TPA: response regulator [Bryobacteraceae bacterium]|jgi:CheY-like chemotaxis protein|nr:response regulator [Bryobacteraceae bacterium]